MIINFLLASCPSSLSCENASTASPVPGPPPLPPIIRISFFIRGGRVGKVLIDSQDKKKNFARKVCSLFYFPQCQESHFPVTFLFCLCLFCLQTGMSRIGRTISEELHHTDGVSQLIVCSFFHNCSTIFNRRASSSHLKTRTPGPNPQDAILVATLRIYFAECPLPQSHTTNTKHQTRNPNHTETPITASTDHAHTQTLLSTHMQWHTRTSHSHSPLSSIFSALLSALRSTTRIFATTRICTQSCFAMGCAQSLAAKPLCQRALCALISRIVSKIVASSPLGPHEIPSLNNLTSGHLAPSFNMWQPGRMCVCERRAFCFSLLKDEGVVASHVKNYKSSCIKTLFQCWNVYDLKKSREGRRPRQCFDASFPPSFKTKDKPSFSTGAGDPPLPKTHRQEKTQRIETSACPSRVHILNVVISNHKRHSGK